ncbi:MAG: DinB family protein, partial [Cystobacter sp.]
MRVPSGDAAGDASGGAPAAVPAHEPAPPGAWKGRAVAELTGARARLVRMLERLDEDTLRAQHSPLMSPIAWDVAHLANYEEQWLLRALGAPALTGPELDALYDAPRHPRATRAHLPLLAPAQALDYAARVRQASLAWLRALP